MAQQMIYRVVQDDPKKEELEGLVHVLEVDGPSVPSYLAVRVKAPQPLERASEDIWRVPSQQGHNPNVPPDVSYWADLPWKQRVSFYWKDITGEQKRELAAFWRTFKNDPLQPIRDYFSNYVITGMGLFLEGYVVFSISNNSTAFAQTYTNCWSTYTVCNETWTQATTYLQLVGILFGQLFFGFLGDWIGRRSAMLIDMSIILIGVIMLTVSNGTSLQGWVVMYAISQFVFGFGIGGEYPMTSTRASEESEESRVNASSRVHRGRKVMLAYTMQGWGQFVNLGLLILLLLIFNSSGNPPYTTGKTHKKLPYSKAAIGATWRTSFGLLIPVVLYLIYYRIYVLRELSALNDAKERGNVKKNSYDWYSFRLLLTHYGHRLFGTSALWFCNDWYFYGNGVFRSTFVRILLGPQAGILTNWLWSFLNSGIQLFGYYFAALSVDWKPWGRRRMTTVSFLMVAAIFLCCAAAFNQLTEKRHIHWFQFLYYFSSFWGLFGSHTTSFLLAAESFPVAVRGTAHGISAASGKVGSVLVVVWFNYASTRGRFWIVWPGALIGAIVTQVFIADSTGLDLAEAERRWEFIRVGRAKDYHGVAVHRRHLSRWEQWVCGAHKQYDPVADRHQIMQAKFNGWTEAEAALKGTDGKGAFSLKGSDWSKPKLADVEEKPSVV